LGSSIICLCVLRDEGWRYRLNLGSRWPVELLARSMNWP
jgi:hypothetical protein